MKSITPPTKPAWPREVLWVLLLVVVAYGTMFVLARRAYSQPDTFSPTAPVEGSTVNNFTVVSNLTIKQNISVSGHATFNDITVTNQLVFTTNLFPVTAGTLVWNFTKPYQRISTNNDWAITGIGGLTNYALNWAVLEFSNSDSATHFCDLSSLPWHVIGTSSTNKVYVGGGKVAFMSANIPGLASSNLVTAVQQ